MSKQAKIFRYNKEGELVRGRIQWTGNFPTDRKGFEQNGFRRLTEVGDDCNVVYDVYTNDKCWLIDIYLFGEHLACIKVTDPIQMLSTVDQISQSCINIDKAVDLAVTPPNHLKFQRI